MSNDVVFGMRLTYEGREANVGLEQTRANVERLGAVSSKMASQYSGLNTVVKEHSTEVKDTEASVRKLLDRYDPLGAKLRQLQADFKALDAAASSGRIAGRDDARTDQVYARLQREITAASSATAAFDGTSRSAALSAGQLRMATQQLPLQFTDIWVSLAAGQNPMMVMLQQGTQIKDSFGGVSTAAQAMGRYVLGLVNPFTLAAAAVVAGGAAWYYWGESAREATEKSKEALAEAEKLAKSTKRMTPAEEVQDITKQIDALKEKNFWIEKNTPSMKAVVGAEKDQLWSGASEERGRRDLDLAKVKANLEAINNLERNRLDIEKQIAQQAESKNKEWEGLHATDAERKATALKGEKKLYDEQVALAKGNSDQLIALETQHQQKIATINSEFEKKAQKKAPRTEADQIRQQEQQALQSLQKQADGYQQLSKVAQVRWEIEHGNYRKFSEQAKQQLLLEAQLADAKDAETKSVKASKDAWDESNKAIDKANTTSKEYVNQLQFENSLLGLSTLEMQKRTEARRIDLALEKELLALRSNDKLKADSGALKAAEDGARQAAEAAKAGAEVEIDARHRVTTSWEFGSKEAIRKYDEQVKNSAAQAESLYTKAFKGAEDAVTQFVMTGKTDVRSLGTSIIEEFTRINVSRPLVNAGAGMLGDIFGAITGGLFGGSPAGASASTVASFGPSAASAGTTDYLALAGMRASGGPVDPNSLYRINERGPEILNMDGNDYLMMGGRGGFVKPLASSVGASAPASTGGTVINLTSAPVINIDARSDQAQVRQLVYSAVRQGNAELVDKLHRQGVL